MHVSSLKVVPIYLYSHQKYMRVSVSLHLWQHINTIICYYRLLDFCHLTDEKWYFSYFQFAYFNKIEGHWYFVSYLFIFSAHFFYWCTKHFLIYMHKQFIYYRNKLFVLWIMIIYPLILFVVLRTIVWTGNYKAFTMAFGLWVMVERSFLFQSYERILMFSCGTFSHLNI